MPSDNLLNALAVFLVSVLYMTGLGAAVAVISGVVFMFQGKDYALAMTISSGLVLALVISVCSFLRGVAKGK